jgi:hypothetical protein
MIGLQEPRTVCSWDELLTHRAVSIVQSSGEGTSSSQPHSPDRHAGHMQHPPLPIVKCILHKAYPIKHTDLFAAASYGHRCSAACTLPRLTSDSECTTWLVALRTQCSWQLLHAP